MISEQGNHISINGMGSANGGTYENVEINGHGKVNGGLQCRNLTTNGRSRLVGEVRADYCQVNGSSIIEGSANVNQLVVHGSSTVNGSFQGQELRVDGHTRFNGQVTVDRVDIRGSLSVGGKMDAETLACNGKFRVDGLLNVEKLELTLHGSSEAQEIGGETIQVKRSFMGSGLGKVVKDFIGISDRLTANVIEGDHVVLEATRAHVVRGNYVTIGPNCEIGLVEYKTELQRDPGSSVREERRI
ncbi:hypothetical protein [Gorillibacterium sp. CAU 1737]|uniref:hypothetical protein n=1 Tax=Gorillibacterium sp. CAU 1737 TaxID=3140362 RepID=UPI0032603895